MGEYAKIIKMPNGKRIVIDTTEDEETGKIQYFAEIQGRGWVTKEQDIISVFATIDEAVKDGKKLLQKL